MLCLYWNQSLQVKLKILVVATLRNNLRDNPSTLFISAIPDHNPAGPGGLWTVSRGSQCISRAHVTLRQLRNCEWRLPAHEDNASLSRGHEGLWLGTFPGSYPRVAFAMWDEIPCHNGQPGLAWTNLVQWSITSRASPSHASTFLFEFLTRPGPGVGWFHVSKSVVSRRYIKERAKYISHLLFKAMEQPLLSYWSKYQLIR